jgi:hypothetical protein
LQVGDTGPVESARRSNSRVLGSPFSGLSGHMLSRKFMIFQHFCHMVFLNPFNDDLFKSFDEGQDCVRVKARKKCKVVFIIVIFKFSACFLPRKNFK